MRDGNSSDAELMFNTSVYPLPRGSAFLRFGENTYQSLPSVLTRSGYTCIALHGDDRQFWNRETAFRHMGFSKYVSEEHFGYKVYGPYGILDECLFEQSSIEMQQINKPYYSFIITITSHMPFQRINVDSQNDLRPDDYTSNYIDAIRYVDRCIGNFCKQLSAAGELENCAIIIYGDHEGIHKYYETELPDNDHKVPFIVHVPGMEAVTVDKIGGQVDMMPTLLHLLGIKEDTKSPHMMGKNLFSSSEGYALLPSGAIIGSPWDREHVKHAEPIARKIILGDYFRIKKQ